MDHVISVSGLLFGVITIGIVYLINRRIGKKRRRFDERQQYVTARAKGMAWNITSAILLAAWVIVILYDGISFAFFLMTGIWIAHNLSLIFTSVYFSQRS
ncbi:hypothetical protein [Bacillus thermotolerans]|uniref:hypothetical protein n=1 Tax=Bacillus thermotolerans TaxID=1221996 RepID=UPI00057FDA51|nr:hypothetical protein [Bacillus thermotolerans]KKB37620.1 hypothetical protein QY97_03983 [Bacillus thermotolerans]KKB38197.1 hypothetical protein QY96_03085 [Bacillus thermotolerans]